MPASADSQSNGSFHDRRLTERMADPEFRAKFERATGEINAIDAI